jgi:hypothetical protein
MKTETDKLGEYFEYEYKVKVSRQLMTQANNLKQAFKAIFSKRNVIGMNLLTPIVSWLKEAISEGFKKVQLALSNESLKDSELPNRLRRVPMGEPLRHCALQHYDALPALRKCRAQRVSHQLLQLGGVRVEEREVRGALLQ